MWLAAKKKETVPAQQDKAAKEGADRRVYPRFSSELQTSCQPIGSGSSWQARVRDVSLGGVGLVLNRHFKPGTLLTMELENSDQRVSRSVLARVVHARQQADGAWMLGCAFSSELDEEELKAFSAQRVSEEPSQCRAWVRFSCNMETTCRTADEGDNRTWSVRILNVAPGGIGLHARGPIDDGIYLNLDVPGGDRSVLIRVIHRERDGDGWFLGCEFASQLTEDELSGLVE